MRSIEVWDEERWGNKLLVLSGEPQLIAPIASQGVDVGEEGGLLDVLLQFFKKEARVVRVALFRGLI